MMFSSADGRVEGLYFMSSAPGETSEWRKSKSLYAAQKSKDEANHSSLLNGYVTLFSREVLRSFQSEADAIITPLDARHNIITTGIDTDMLEGSYFTVGGVTLRGVGASKGLHIPAHYRSNRALYTAMQDRVGQIAEVISPGYVFPHDVIALGGLATAHAQQAA